MRGEEWSRMAADKDTLLSFIARRHAIGLEDVATDALRFILSRSASARGALSDVLGDDCGPLPIATAETWLADAYGAIPDLACYDETGSLVALIESKFWANLTHHQPVTYWQGLPTDRPAVLLFLAPASRVDEPSLWDELVARLRDAGHGLGPAHKGEGLVTAHATADKRRLMLTSWNSLLSTMAQRAERDGDAQACFEIAELETGLEWRSGEVYMPIVLPRATDRQATLDAIVAELERIARIIDPNGPTYREHAP